MNPEATLQPKRALIYQLMMSQLRADGYPIIASHISRASMIPLPSESAFPENYLMNLVSIGLSNEGGSWDEIPSYESADPIPSVLTGSGPRASPLQQASSLANKCVIPAPGVAHLLKFSPDGQHLAVASKDHQLKLYDTKILKGAGKNESTIRSALKRVYIENREEITDISFHPHTPIVATASNDCTIRLFNYKSPFAKKSSTILTDGHSINSIDFHPSGQYILCGTNHHAVRLYDLNPSSHECYTSADREFQHSRGIRVVKFSRDGKLFATGCLDGSIKIWDAVSFSVIHTMNNATKHEAIESIEFSSNGQYILTSSRDSVVKLWEVSTGRAVNTFVGAHMKTRSNASFTPNEGHIISCDDNQNTVIAWVSHTREIQHRIRGHLAPIIYTCCSPVDPFLIASASKDKTVCLWGQTDALMS